MKKSRFTETQIVDALKRHENGQSIADLARELGITPATFHAWRKKYAGMDATHLKRLKELEAENAKLKKMYAELALDNVALKDVVSKKW
jgi:putative transposase